MTLYEQILNILGPMPTDTLDFTYIVSCVIFILMHILVIKLVLSVFKH